MVKVTFLGTASAVPNQFHQNSHFIVESEKRTLLIDCVGNPVSRLDQAGIDPIRIDDLILTHFHPDHVSGTPLLLMDLWLMGRKKPLDVFGMENVIVRIRQMMDLYDWQTWEGFYPVNFVCLDDQDQDLFFDQDGLKIWSAPVCHMIPGIGLRMEFPEGNLVYSSDTGPCDQVVELAKGADILIHESTGEGHGHASPAQAGQIAQKAKARALYLIHYPPDCDLTAWIEQAQANFSGDVFAAEDLMSVEF
jgi:ribonuclease Z